MNPRTLSVAALLLASITSVSAQEGVKSWKDEVLSTRSRSSVLVEPEQARAEGSLDNRGESYGSIAATRDRSPSTLTRAEVLADLQLWRESGLAALDRREAGIDPFSPEARVAQARYVALRASPRYAELVRGIAEGRDGVTVASPGAKGSR